MAKNAKKISYFDRIRAEPWKGVKDSLIAAGPLIGYVAGASLLGPVGIAAALASYVGLGVGSLPAMNKAHNFYKDKQIEDFLDNAMAVKVDKIEGGEKGSRTVYMHEDDLKRMGLSEGGLVYVENRHEGWWRDLLGMDPKCDYVPFEVKTDKLAKEGHMRTSSDLVGNVLVSPKSPNSERTKTIGKRKVGFNPSEESTVPIKFLKGDPAKTHKYYNDDQNNLQIGDEVIVLVSYIAPGGKVLEKHCVAKVGASENIATLDIEGIAERNIKSVKILYGGLNEADDSGVNEARAKIAAVYGDALASELEGVLAVYSPKERSSLITALDPTSEIAKFKSERDAYKKNNETASGRIKKLEEEIEGYKVIKEQIETAIGDNLENLLSSNSVTPAKVPVASSTGNSSSYSKPSDDPDDTNDYNPGDSDDHLTSIDVSADLTGFAELDDLLEDFDNLGGKKVDPLVTPVSTSPKSKVGSTPSKKPANTKKDKKGKIKGD